MPKLQYWSDFLILIALRYFVVAGLAFLVWYVFRNKMNDCKKIQQKQPQSNDYVRELVYSIMTIFIFATLLFVLLSKKLPIRNHTFFYEKIDDYGMFWFWICFPIMLIVHDTYFYFAHRFMHLPKVFKVLHQVHHKSTNPTPWAAFAFHPLEALIEGGIMLVFLFLMPITKYHFFFFFTLMLFYNVYGHLGWELYPEGFSKTKIGRWINTSTHHNQHHEFVKGNYGLYFLWWDKWLNTIRKENEPHQQENK